MNSGTFDVAIQINVLARNSENGLGLEHGENKTHKVMNKTFKTLLAVVTTVSIAITSASAIPLSDLMVPGATITEGDKIFGDFDFTSNDVDPADVQVSTLVVGDVYYLIFQGPFTAGPGEVSDSGILYSVTTTGGKKISMIDQAFTLSATGGGGLISIGETVWKNGFFSGNVAQSTVSFGVTGADLEDPPGEVVQGDNLIIDPPLSKIFVTKDVFLEGAGPSVDFPGGGSVGATVIAQSFHQVPDGGATLGLLGAGMLGLIALRRKLS